MLVLVLGVMALVYGYARRGLAPAPMAPWIDTGCDLAQGPCAYRPLQGQRVEASARLEVMPDGDWGSFEVLVEGLHVAKLSLQATCLDQAMQHIVVPMQAVDDGQRFSLQYRLPDCLPGTRARQIRVYMESGDGGPSAVAFHLSTGA